MYKRNYCFIMTYDQLFLVCLLPQLFFIFYFIGLLTFFLLWCRLRLFMTMAKRRTWIRITSLQTKLKNSTSSETHPFPFLILFGINHCLMNKAKLYITCRIFLMSWKFAWRFGNSLHLLKQPVLTSICAFIVCLVEQARLAADGECSLMVLAGSAWMTYMWMSAIHWGRITRTDPGITVRIMVALWWRFPQMARQIGSVFCYVAKGSLAKLLYQRILKR